MNVADKADALLAQASGSTEPPARSNIATAIALLAQALGEPDTQLARTLVEQARALLRVPAITGTK